MSAASETPVTERQILLVGPYGVLGTGVIDAIAESPKWRITSAARRRAPVYRAQAAQDEALIRLRGLADHFEKEDPAMHKANTVDYAVVWDGEIWLELDNSETPHLKRGDVVVQNGARHAWRNKGIQPVKMLFFLNGATA